MLRSLRLQRDASRSIRQYSHWSGSHRWNDGLNLKGKAAASNIKSPKSKDQSGGSTEISNKPEESAESPQASTSAIPLNSSKKGEAINAKGSSSDQVSSSSSSLAANQNKEQQQKQQKKPHLPAVPVLHAPPTLIATDSLFAQHRPLLEVRIPKNKRRTATAQSQQAPPEQGNPFLDELTGQSNDPVENLQLGPVDTQNTAAAKYLATRTAFSPPLAPEPPASEPSTKDKDLAYLSPFSKQAAFKSKYPQSPSFLAGQFSSFLKRVNSKLNTEEQQALDAFFQSNEPVEDAVKRHNDSRYASTKHIKDEGFAAAIEAAKHFISLLPSIEVQGGKAYRLNKSNDGEWVAEEMDSFAPGEMQLGGEGSAVAYVEQLPDGTPLVEEDGVEIIDLTKAGNGSEHLSSILGMLQKAFVKPGQDKSSEFSTEQIISDNKLASILLEDGGVRNPSGNRFPLGPRNLARRGVRSIPGMHINLDSVKRKRKTKVSPLSSSP